MHRFDKDWLKRAGRSSDRLVLWGSVPANLQLGWDVRTAEGRRVQVKSITQSCKPWCFRSRWPVPCRNIEPTWMVMCSWQLDGSWPPLALQISPIFFVVSRLK